MQCGHCRDDTRRVTPQSVKHCESCDHGYCDDCRYSKLSKDWVNACEGCIKLIAVDLGKRIHKDKEEENAKHMATI